MSELERWRELPDGAIEFAMPGRRPQTDGELRKGEIIGELDLPPERLEASGEDRLRTLRN